MFLHIPCVSRIICIAERFKAFKQNNDVAGLAKWIGNHRNMISIAARCYVVRNTWRFAKLTGFPIVEKPETKPQKATSVQSNLGDWLGLSNFEAPPPTGSSPVKKRANDVEVTGNLYMLEPFLLDPEGFDGVIVEPESKYRIPIAEDFSADDIGTAVKTMVEKWGYQFGAIQ